MIRKAEHKISIEQYRAPFRGISSRSDFVNFYLSIIHDMKYMENQIGLDSSYRGLRQKEKTNFDFVFNKTENIPTTNLFTAGRYSHLLGDVDYNKDLIQWQKENNAIVKTNKDKSFNVASDGKLDPCSISINIDANTGDIIHLRFKLKKVKGTCDSIYLGTDDLNAEGPDLKNINLTNRSSSIYVEKRLYCNQKQSLLLKIYLHKVPNKLEPTEISIDDLSIRYMSEEDITNGSIETTIKPKLSSLEQKVGHLKSFKKGG